MAGSSVSPYDVKLNGNKYLIVPSTYHEGAVRSTVRPLSTPGGDPSARNNEEPAWAWWSQTRWLGDSVDDWKGDNAGGAGWYRGYGVDISSDGEIASAQRFVSVLADASNPDGYLLIPFSSTVDLVIGKTDGNTWTTTDRVTFTNRGYADGAANGGVGAAFYKGALIVGMANGDLRTFDGALWSAYAGPAKPNNNPAMPLGVYRSKLYISWNNDLRTWDGTTLTQVLVLDGNPVVAAVGSGSMFIPSTGTPSHLYMVQGDQVVELMQWPDDSVPYDALFLDTLYIATGKTDSAGGREGDIWRYNQQGLELLYSVPALYGVQDYGIRSLSSDGMQLMFSANKGAGVGTFDPGLDNYQDPVFGFAIGSRTNTTRTGAGIVSGILPTRGSTLIGIAGEGLFNSSGFCDFQVASSLFGSISKRVTKLWGLCELSTTTLQVGQSVLMEYSTDGGTTWTTLGIMSYANIGIGTQTATKAYLPFPAQMLSPVLQYRATGTANNADLAILDISFSFIEASQNPKRKWSFVIGIGGSSLEPMSYRDGTDFERSGPAMKAELDALWNKRFTFEDLFGHTYTVMMPEPGVDVDDVVKMLNAGDLTTVDSVLANYRVHLVEV